MQNVKTLVLILLYIGKVSKLLVNVLTIRYIGFK